MLVTGSYVNGSALRSASLADRDLETQQRLLGADAFVPSPESPLHHLRPTSPLSEASHLQDEIEQESIRDRAARSPPRYVDGDAPLHCPVVLLPYLSNRVVFHTSTDHILIYHRSISPVDDAHDHSSEGALGLFFATAPSRIQHTPLPPLAEELPIVPTTRSRAATVPQTRSLPTPMGPTPHPLYPRTTRVYPQPHVVEIAREMIGSSQQQPQPQSRPSTSRSLPSSDSMNVPLRPKEKEVVTRRRFFRLWKETVTVQEPAKQEVDDVWAAWEKEQRRAQQMTIAAALDNKPRFAYVEQQPSTEPISRVSSNNSSDESPAETDHHDYDCHGMSAFFRSLFHRRMRASQHVRRTAPARAS